MPDELIEHEPQFLAEVPQSTLQTSATLNLLQTAIERGISPEALEKLVALQERIMDRQAEAEFNAAMRSFQSEVAPVVKNRIADTGKYKYAFADLSQVAEWIRPLLDTHGFSYTFDSSWENSGVTAKCIVRHVSGHKETTQFQAPIDSKAVMNDTQKSAAAITYARRYALLLAFGLSVGEDTDYQTAPQNPERRPDAPKTPPRNQRQKPPRDRLRDIYMAWMDLHGSKAPEGIAKMDRDAITKANGEKFTEWAVNTAGYEFDALKPEAWTDEWFSAATEALRFEQEARA